MAVVLSPVGLDARDVLALAHRDCVGGSATAAVVQRRWDPRGVDDVETDAVEALAGADGDGLDAVSRDTNSKSEYLLPCGPPKTSLS